jgi:hypothetical protein
MSIYVYNVDIEYSCSYLYYQIIIKVLFDNIYNL